MRPANLLLVAAAAAAAIPLTMSCVVADGIPGLVMTDSQYLTDWSGFYIGGKLGGAFSSNINWHQELALFTANSGRSEYAHSVLPRRRRRWRHRRRQPSAWAVDLWGRGVVLGHRPVAEGHKPVFPATDTFSTTLDWLLTVEGRVGYSWDRVMVFGKGGLAASDATLRVTSSHPLHGGTASVSEFVKGWTIGGGIEYAAWNSVIIGIEYDYVNLNLTKGGSCPLCDAGLQIDSTPSAISGDATMSAVMLRASYLFAAED